MSLLISELVERGLYPRKLIFHEDKVVLELIQLSSERFDAGFYVHQIKKDMVGDPAHVDLDALQIDANPAYPPAGYIYHLGRSGSTVAVNMLNSLERYQVIAEAPVFPDLVTADLRYTKGRLQERRKKITILFCLLGERNNRKTIFKMASWEVRQRSAHFQLYPEVKSCLVVRNMTEIMVALLQDPPRRYRRNKIRSRIAQEKSLGSDQFHSMLTGKFGEGVDYLAAQPYVDFIGSALQALLRDALNSTAPYLVIDHKDVVKRVPTDLCAYFDIHPDEKQIQEMQYCAGYDAKAMNKNEQYLDDSGRKSAEATPETRKWCVDILQPMLEEIIRKNSATSGREDR